MSAWERSFFGFWSFGGLAFGGAWAFDGELLRTSEAEVKNGLTVLLLSVFVPLMFTEVVFMALRGIRGGSMAVGTGSQYAVENGSMDLMVGSI